MQKPLVSIAAALFLFTAAPAFAAYDDTWTPANYAADAPAKTYQTSNQAPPPLLFVFGAIAVGVVVTIMMAISQSSNDAHRLPKELQPKESAEHYDQEAVRARAFARKLDAEAALAESQLQMSLKQDELKEFEAFLRDKKKRDERKDDDKTPLRRR